MDLSHEGKFLYGFLPIQRSKNSHFADKGDAPGNEHVDHGTKKTNKRKKRQNHGRIHQQRIYSVVKSSVSPILVQLSAASVRESNLVLQVMQCCGEGGGENGSEGDGEGDSDGGDINDGENDSEGEDDSESEDDSGCEGENDESDCDDKCLPKTSRLPDAEAISLDWQKKVRVLGKLLIL